VLACQLALELALDLLVLVAARLRRVRSKHSKVGSKVGSKELSGGLHLLALVAATCCSAPEVRTHECPGRYIQGHMRLKRQYASDCPWR